jgi:NADH:ubiquinone oxidoreductase subunit F (NADH-binding)/NAD-dependent dihydropyrimidine dehydrogenase PreA subunit/(2Fe-2S) ferredoxin
MKRASDEKDLQDIQKRAEKDWIDLLNGDLPLVCTGMSTCGISARAGECLLGIESLLKDRGIAFRSMNVGCLGLCFAEPLIYIKMPDRPFVCYGYLSPDNAASLVDAVLEGGIKNDLALGAIELPEIDVPAAAVPGITSIWDHPMLRPQVRIALRNCGIIDPENIMHYIARGGYKAQARVLTMKPEDVIEEVKISGLRGRGGAGFPAATKWEFCRRAKGTEKYLICNADEGDPGAFMDRSILEGDPHAVLEGMVIAAHAIGCTRGFIYCRAEYPLALKRLELALRQARELGVLGENILESGFDFDISIKEGAGAFVCGEETALMASIEGRRGMPRTRPPFPATSGLWGKPTNINNVETLANLATIINRGGSWYSGFGIGRSRGTKTLSLAGAVRRAGLIEVPMGMTLRQIIFEIGGGISGNKACKGVLTGGPSGGCIPSSSLDATVDYESLTDLGSIMGSGSMIIIDEDTCVVDLAMFFLTFTQRESCGKCTPCRIGTRQMLAILQKIAGGEAEIDDLARLERLANVVRNGSLCGLGAGLPNPVLTTMKYFREEYEQHIRDKTCPAQVCRGLIEYSIDPERCRGCGLCSDICPAGAISGERKAAHVIDPEACIKCGSCMTVCPEKFGAVIKEDA